MRASTWASPWYPDTTSISRTSPVRSLRTVTSYVSTNVPLPQHLGGETRWTTYHAVMQSVNGVQKDISLVASRTIDRIVGPDGRTVALPGGPAMYVGQALERLGRPYKLHTGELAEVLVLPGQRYVVPELAPIPLPERFETPAVLLDPISNEIPVEGLPPYSGLLAVDIQGYVRRPGQPADQLAVGVDLKDLLARCSVVKAAEVELCALDSASREALEQTILVVTRAERGATIRWRGGSVSLRADLVTEVHTIGAGDIFLAGFVDALLRGAAPDEAGKRATTFVSAMLRERRV